MNGTKLLTALRGKLAAPTAALGVAVLSLAAAAAAPARPELTEEPTGDQAIAETVRPHLGGVRHEVAILVVDPEGARETLFDTTATTPFFIGSVTKLFTVELYIEAVRRDEVDPDTALGSLLPMGDSPAASVTLDELAHHEGGFGEWGADDQFQPDFGERMSARMLHTEPREHTTLEELYERARRDPLSGRGSYQYSNIGIALLGHALASAADTTYEKLLDERLLKPLNMRRTGFPNQDNLNPPRGLDADGTHAPIWELGAYAPAGGAMSTLMDLGQFARYIASSPEPVTEAAGNRAVYRGFRVNGLDGRRVLTKVGTVAGFQAVILIDPEAHRAVVMLSDSWNSILDAAEALVSDEEARRR